MNDNFGAFSVDTVETAECFDAPVSPLTKGHLRHWPLLLKVLVAAAILFFIRNQFDSSLFRKLVNYPWLMLIPVAGWCLNQILTTIRLYTLMRALNIHARLNVLLYANFSSLFLGNIMPGSLGADVIKFFYIRRSGVAISRSELAMVLIMDRFLGLMAIMMIGSIFAFPVMGRATVMTQLVWLPILLLVGMIGGLVVARFAANYIERIPKMPKLIVNATCIYARLFRTKNMGNVAIIFLCNLIAVFVLLASLVTVGGVFAAARQGTPMIAEQFFLIPLSLIVAMLPLTPLGIGTTQFSMVEAYKWLLIDPSIGVMVSTVSQVALVAVSILIGGPLFLLTKRTKP